jgi:hypothetical protein
VLFGKEKAMSLAAWNRRLRSSLHAFCHWLWPPTPEDVRQQQAAALAGELQRRHQQLIRIRQRLERRRGLLEALAREEQRLTLTIQLLTQEGQDQEAYRTALDLERLRKKQMRLGERMRQGEAAYQERCTHFQEVKQRGRDSTRRLFLSP